MYVQYDCKKNQSQKKLSGWATRRKQLGNRTANTTYNVQQGDLTFYLTFFEDEMQSNTLFFIDEMEQ